MSNPSINRSAFYGPQMQSVGRDFMVFGVQGNEDSRDELYENWLFRVYDSGRIETLWHEDGVLATAPSIGYDKIGFVKRDPDGVAADELMCWADFDSDFPTYQDFNETKYITNFRTAISFKGSLFGIRVAFEKIFNDEELIVSYRTSDREDFTVLDTINKEVIQNSDNYYDPALKATEDSDDSVAIEQQHFDITWADAEGQINLPEFYEIQFKFESSNGFSVAQAWYMYDDITRHDLGKQN